MTFSERNKKIILLVILAISTMFALYLSFNQRLNQLKEWEKNPSLFVDGIEPMTTLDAYKWLKDAKDYNAGLFGSGKKDINISYPDSPSYPDKPNMIVFILSKFSGLFGGDYYKAGLYSTTILSGLFIIPLAVIFYLFGSGAAGILGGLLGTFSYAYYVRSCMGRVDTDLLNLFFPIIISLFIILVVKFNNIKFKYLSALFAGIFLNLFMWWYHQKGFAAAYLGIFIIMLAVNKEFTKESYKQGIGLLVLFILASNPFQIINGFSSLFSFLGSAYFSGEGHKLSNVVWPNILETITETQKKDYKEVMAMIIGSYKLVAVGLVGLIAAAVVNWRYFIALTPPIVLGLLAFKSSNRFAMYLAPFAGAGLGYIIHLILEYSLKYFKIDVFYGRILTYLLVFMVFFSSAEKLTAYKYIPGPSVDPKIVSSFLELKGKLPEKSPVFTWWDYGYAIMDIAGMSTYHDGGVHGGDRTYFVAKGLTSTNQNDLYGIISYIDREGFKGLENLLKDNISADSMLKKVTGDMRGPKNDNVSVLFTYDMIGKFGAISFFGSWDFNTKKSTGAGFQPLYCTELKNEILTCQGAKVDLRTGKINDQVTLKRFAGSQNGNIGTMRFFPNDSNLTLEMVMINQQVVGIYLITEEVYNSNFNQMYILGKYDQSKFQEVYNNFPIARAFKVRKNG